MTGAGQEIVTHGSIRTGTVPAAGNLFPPCQKNGMETVRMKPDMQPDNASERILHAAGLYCNPSEGSPDRSECAKRIRLYILRLCSNGLNRTSALAPVPSAYETEKTQAVRQRGNGHKGSAQVPGNRVFRLLIQPRRT